MAYNWNAANLDYNNLGAKQNGNFIEIRTYLPFIDSSNFKIDLHILSENYFYSNPPSVTPMMCVQNPNNQDECVWECMVNTTGWADGTYLYWINITRNDGLFIDNVIEPFAREFGLGKYSAFTIGLPSSNFTAPNPPTRPVDELIVYEMHLQEFANSINDCILRLDYLVDLGVNTILIMPVTNVSDQVNWGYLPLGYFGIDEKFGNRRDFQHLVDECHKKGIAVILDAVFAHTSPEIAFNVVYQKFGITSPICGNENRWGGIAIDYTKSTSARFVQSAISSMIDNLKIDGLRFDYVAGYINAYPSIAAFAKSEFTMNNIQSPIIMAELLWGTIPPEQSLNQTISNICYQNYTFETCTRIANAWRDNDRIPTSLLWNLGYHDFSANDFLATQGKLPLQYIENHDHKRFVCNYYKDEEDNNFDFMLENSSKTSSLRKTYGYKVQPFLIGMILSKGVPLLWQGQELCENYWVTEELESDKSISRVKVPRSVRWEYGIDSLGKSIHTLTKSLISIRSAYKGLFCKGGYYFIDNEALYQNNGVLVYERIDKINDKTKALVVINFTDGNQNIRIPPEYMNSTCLLGGISNPQNTITVNSNYGAVLLKDRE